MESLLHCYYHNVTLLSSYLDRVLSYPQSNSISFHPRPDDPPAYKDLINSSYVAWSDLDSSRLFTFFPPMTDMREVLDQAQERIFKSKQPNNVITLGYRLASGMGDRGKKGMVRSGITNTFINTIVTALHGPEWDLLLQRIGVDAMLHLLTETSMFTSLPHQCLCQITGDPLIHVVPDLQNPQESTAGTFCANENGSKKRHQTVATHPRPHKKRRLNDESTVADSSQKKAKMMRPSDVSIDRKQLFYSRPCFLPHSYQIAVGLSLKHILNRLAEQGQRQQSSESPDPGAIQQMEEARHLSKYIFPRQYRLSNCFEKTLSARDNYTLDFTNREIEIKAAGSCKTPKRLRDVIPMVEKLIWRHKKCGYKALRDISCPSKILQSGAQRLDKNIILELMSEQYMPFRSQRSLSPPNTSLDSTRQSVFPVDLTQAKANAIMKPRFTEFTCGYTEVYRYVVLVTKAVIPKSFWGSESNFKLVLRYVKEFISCRRFETITLHHIVQGFSTSACNWLMPPGEAAKKQSRVSVSDSQKRRELLEEFLYWYFDSFVLSLLKTTFYVTESSAFKNVILFFRQDDWATLCSPLIERLIERTFERIPDSDVEDILRQRKLGFSFVRLLPKETGVRPIVNLKRKAINGPYQAQQSINQVLQAAFHILSYERENQHDLLGVSIFGPDDIYTKLRSFKARLLDDFSGKIPKLFFVKVDVQTCFDTIEQSKLLQILHAVISEDTYMIRKYGEISLSAGRIRRRYTRDAVPEDEAAHFLQLAKELATLLRRTIFVDQVKYSYAKKEEILHLLEEHIRENIVKIGQHYYRQIVGIPQGSVLSALLCSFFYGDMEKQFGSFVKHPHNVLLRMVDDYLFVTPDVQVARSFLNMMNQGHPEYGCFISREKTVTNFDHGVDILNVIDSELQSPFLWCGYSIDIKTLSISVDYSRYTKSGLASSLTVERGRHPGLAFFRKLLQSSKARLHAIYIDPLLNSEHIIYQNIYQNYLLTALKMMVYLRDWKNGMKNIKFINSTIQKSIFYSYCSIRVQLRRQVMAFNDGLRSPVHKWAVVWLGNHAFHHVLSRKYGQFNMLLKPLEKELSRPRYHRFRRRFRKLIQKSQEVLNEIPMHTSHDKST